MVDTADMAAAWTACTKLLFAEKKWDRSRTPERGDLLRGFAFFAGFFEGGFGKSGGKRVVFCGDFVVEVWWHCGFWMVIFRS